VTYPIELEHPGLRKHRIIKGKDDVVERRKAELQAAEWEDQWEKKNAALKKARIAKRTAVV
jgi:hypothetical protein